MYIPTVLLPSLIRLPRRLPRFPGLRAGLFLAAWAGFLAAPAPAAEAGSPVPATAPESGPPGRTFRTFLPGPGALAEEPRGRIIQLLLDRQDKDGYESYMIQVLFRGAPARERSHRVLPDRVEIDFFDTGKPAMRLARIRGGALEATSLEEFHYRDGGKLKSLVRLTLFIHAQPSLRFRDTLDRTLIHFRLARAEGLAPEKSLKSAAPGDTLQ